MSYLLTEIALEMLGYKFYDIDGSFGKTNFQNSGQPHSNTAVDETTDHEQTLETILNPIEIQMDDSSKNLGTSTATTVSLATPEIVDAATDEINLLAEMDVDANDDTDIALPPNQQHSVSYPTTGLKANKRKPLPSALSRLLDHEYSRIRGQIVRHKNTFVQSSSEMLNKSDQRGNVAMQDIKNRFDNEERANLEKELQTIHTFRKMVERSLLRANSDNFEKYKKIFVRQSEELDIVIDINNE